MTTTRGNLNARTKRQIVATLAAHMGLTCKACGRETIQGGSPTDGRSLNMGHIVSEANGGTYSVGNLLPICRRCNAYMGESDWTTVAPMLAAPLAHDTRLVSDPGTVQTYFDAPPWA